MLDRSSRTPSLVSCVYSLCLAASDGPEQLGLVGRVSSTDAMTQTPLLQSQRNWGLCVEV